MNEMQKMIVQFQMLEANLKALQERAAMLNGRLEEIQSTKMAIEDLEKVKPSKALIPLGSGNFIPGTIESTKEVMIGVGGGIAVKKKREEALVLLDTRFKEIEKELVDATNQSTKIALQMERIQEQVERMQK